MFSADRRTAGEQRVVPQPGSPRLHLHPWLHNGLKTPHLGRENGSINGACQQAKTGLNYLDRTLSRTRELSFGFLSKDKVDLPGRSRTDVRKNVSNGLGLGRSLGLGTDKKLPEILPDPHEKPGSMKGKTDTSPAKTSQPPGPEPGPGAITARVSRLGHGPAPGPEQKPSLEFAPGTASESGQVQNTGASVMDYCTDVSFVRDQLNPPRTGPYPSDRKLRLAPVATAAWFKGQTNCGSPVHPEGGKVWGCAGTPGLKDQRSSLWVRSYSQGGGENRSWSALSSSTSSSTLEQRRSFPASGDLSRHRDDFTGPCSLQKALFSTEVPHRDKGALGPRSHNRSELLQPRPGRQDQRPRREAGPGAARCSRRDVQDQIRRVMDSLENVLGGLKDVHQEMKEVVQQIEYLTSSIDLSEEEPSCSSRASSSSSSSSGVTVGPGPRTHPGLEPTQVDLNPPCSPRGTLGPPLVSSLADSPWGLYNPGCSPRRGGPAQPPFCPPTPQDEGRASELCSLTRMKHMLCQASCSPRTSLVRPPTPGLSPLRVKIDRSHPPPSPSPHPPSRRLLPLPPQPPPSPVSPLSLLPPLSPLPLQPLASPPLSPLPQPPPLGPSARVENHLGSTQAPHGDHPSARTIPPSPSPPPSPPPPGSPHRDPDTQPGRDRHLGTDGSTLASITQDAASALCPGSKKAPGPRGRKPPPYPHAAHQERVKKGKEPRREVPPYPVKRRLLSTTV